MTVRDDSSGEERDDPFTGLDFDEPFVLGARTRELSFADRERQRSERKIISLDEERARRMREGREQTYIEWLFDGVELPRSLRLPSPQLVAVLMAFALAALLLGGPPPFLR